MFGHTSDHCYANSPSPTTKGKGRSPRSKGKGGKGALGDRKWKSPNFPAEYSSEQATPALHDESPSKDTTQEWWDGKELGSSCFEQDNNNDQTNNMEAEYDEAEIAEEIDFHFLAIIQNIERQKAYLLAPTAEKLHTFNEHEEFIVLAASQLNVHSQRIVRTFREQLGYEGCMDTFLANNRSIEANRAHPETKPATDTNLQFEHHSHLASDLDTNINEGNTASTNASSCFSPRDREVSINLLLEDELVLDLAGQASPECKDHDNDIAVTCVHQIDNTPNVRAPQNRALEAQLRARQLCHLERRLQFEIFTHLSREIDMATVNSLLAWEPKLIPKMKFTLDLRSHQHGGIPIDSAHSMLIKDLKLPIRFSAEIMIDAPLKRDFTIDTIQNIIAQDFASQLSIHLRGRTSPFSPRDREILDDPPLVGGSYLTLAGQAGVDGLDVEGVAVTLNGVQAVSIHAADGTHIGAAPNLETAAAAVVEHEMAPVLVH
jgi:hypothetical protein